MYSLRTSRMRAVARVFACAITCLLIDGLAAVYAQCVDTTICSNGVFCSGFEEGNKATWDDWDGNPDATNLLMVDPGPCNKPSGNHVMRLRATSGPGGAADVVKVLPTSHDKLYARWYQKWEPGYDFSIGNHGGGLFAGDRNLLGSSGIRPNGSDWYTSWWETLCCSWSGQSLTGVTHLYSYYRGMYQQCSNPSGDCYGDSFPCMYDEGTNFCSKAQHRETVRPPVMVTNRWYCVEVLLDGGTPSATGAGANGAQNYWIDNVQYGPWTDLWHRTTSNLKINILWLNLYFGANHPNAGVMLDDVVVSTTRVGCHGTSAVPGAPTNLRIIPGADGLW